MNLQRYLQIWSFEVSLDVISRESSNPQNVRYTEDDFAAVQDAYHFISWSTVGLDFEKLW